MQQRCETAGIEAEETEGVEEGRRPRPARAHELFEQAYEQRRRVGSLAVPRSSRAVDKPENRPMEA